MAEESQQDELLPPVDATSAIFASFVDTEGRLLKLRLGAGGAIEMVLETGRGPQLRSFDRFQSSALRQALGEMGGDG